VLNSEYNSQGIICVAVLPGYDRTMTGNIVRDMNNYYILKLPKTKVCEKDLKKENEVLTNIGDHSNIIRRVIFNDAPDEYFLALGFAKAKGLFDYMTKKRPNIVRGSERWSRFFFRQFMSGLQQIHNRGIAHLDIKIDNVLLDIEEKENGHLDIVVKIADFGMSEPDSNEVTTRRGSCYIPPEVFNTIKAYSGNKSDVWSSSFVLLALYTLDWFLPTPEEKIETERPR
jgi:serine/threonine protein kinase